MKSIIISSIQSHFSIRSISKVRVIYFMSAVIIPFILITANASGETDATMARYEIAVERLTPDEKGGYGYKLQYYVPVPIDIFWRFKTDFNSDLLLTNDELVGHRLVRTLGSSVITENRYATAPELKFVWQTKVRPRQYRLEFQLLNAADCRHDFHNGTIQLTAAGRYTMVTQIAYFDFAGATLWVNYPWNGGMKSTLKQVAKWEQQIALKLRHDYIFFDTYHWHPSLF